MEGRLATYKTVGEQIATDIKVDVAFPDLKELIYVIKGKETVFEPQIVNHVQVPPQLAPEITVMAPPIPEHHIHLPEINFQVPVPEVRISSPNINVEAPTVQIEAPRITVQQEASKVEMSVSFTDKTEMKKLLLAVYCLLGANVLILAISTAPIVVKILSFFMV